MPLNIAFAFSQSIPNGTSKKHRTKTVKKTRPAISLKTYTVTGKVTQTYSYCGGAAPPKDLLDEMATPVAFPGKRFYIRPGVTNNSNVKIVKSFTTAEDGSFSIQLAPGIYAVIVEEQLNKIPEL